MNKRTTTWLAWSIWALALIFSIGSLFFWAVNDPAELLQQILFTPAFLAFTTVGALIASRRPENPIGWIFCAVGLTNFGLFAQQYAWYTVLTRPGALPGGAWMAWLGVWIGIVGYYLPFTLTLLLFPVGHLPSRRWRPIAWLAIAFLASNSIGLALKPGPIPIQSTVLPINNPVGIEALAGLLDALNNAGNFLLLPLFVACVIAPIVRFRRARGDEREQFKWVAYAAFTFLVTLVIGQFAPGNGQQEPIIITFLFVLGIASFPIAVGIAILKYRLYDIDVIIRRTLVYGALTAFLGALYYGSVLLLETLLRPIVGENNDLAIVISTLAIAALFNPVRLRVQRFIDRRFYRRKYDAARTLEAFSATLRDEVDLPTLTARLTEVVQETMQPSHVGLWLRVPEGVTGEKPVLEAK